MIRAWLKDNVFNLVLFFVVLLGIFLRFKGFVSNPSLWHDECALGWNIKFADYKDYFSILEFGQMAPPFFMVLTKFLTKIFGVSDLILRVVPFLAGCASLVLFAPLCKKVLTSNLSIFIALILFALNQQLINYSYEFKPYGIDVFFTIACLLFFASFDIQKYSKNKILFAGILISIIPWFSFICAILIAAGFLNVFIKNIKSDWDKKLLLIAPMIVSALFYFWIYLANNYVGNNLVNYWHGCFLTLDFWHNLKLFVDVLTSFFFPFKYILFAFILLIWGTILLYKDKREFSNILIMSFVFLIGASFFKIYPIFYRLILFMLPIVLLWVCKPLDIVSSKNKIGSILILFLTFVLLFSQISGAVAFSKMKSYARNEYPRESMEFMAKELKPDDIIFINEASEIEFKYYSSFYDFKNKTIIDKVTGKSEKDYINFLKSLPKGNYWFYLPYDSQDFPVSNWILKWSKTKKVQFFTKGNLSVLIYIIN